MPEEKIETRLSDFRKLMTNVMKEKFQKQPPTMMTYRACKKFDIGIRFHLSKTEMQKKKNIKRDPFKSTEAYMTNVIPENQTRYLNIVVANF